MALKGVTERERSIVFVARIAVKSLSYRSEWVTFSYAEMKILTDSRDDLSEHLGLLQSD